MKRASTTRRLAAIAASLAMAAGAALSAPIGALAAEMDIGNAGGPLTHILITTLTNCQVNHTGDASFEFYGGDPGACGTFLATGGTLYGPASVPAGGNASPRTAWTAVSQSAVTGTGTGGDPFTVVTVVDAGATGLRVTETDSYVTGQESYRTAISVANTGGSTADAVLYRAGDCYLQNSDSGYGSSSNTTGAVACVNAVSDGAGGTMPGPRIEQWFPLSSGSAYNENGYSEVWAAIGAQTPFANTCTQCANDVDNGAGLSWSITIPAGGSVTRSHLTTFSPLGIAPLVTNKTANQSQTLPGTSDGYTITIHNGNGAPGTVSTITDTLPAGFTYTAGSTTGATTSDPAISGHDLTWTGPFTDPAGGDVTLHFSVTVSQADGTYFNNAGGTAQDVAVASTGDTAAITVGVPTSPSPSPSPAPSVSPSPSVSPAATVAPTLPKSGAAGDPGSPVFLPLALLAIIGLGVVAAARSRKKA